jgi:integrase
MREVNLLTARKAATAGDGWHADGNRLYLRVDGPRRRWIVKVVRDGKKREFGVGSFETTGLALARQKRDKLLEQLRQGLDLKAQRAKARAERDADRLARKKRKTFFEVAREVIVKQESGWRTASDGRQSSLADWTRSLLKDCAPLKSKPVADIKTADVIRVLQPLWDRGKHATARRLVTRIAMVMNFATVHGLRSGDNPASWDLIQHAVPPQPNGRKAHHPALDWREAPAFMARLRAVESIEARCAEFIVLTAARSGEARGARWKEVVGATWTLPPERMKGAEEHTVPLTRQALDLIGRPPKAGDSDLIFPGLKDYGAVLDVVQRLAAGMTLHGFRSSFRSWCGDHGVPREVAEQCLAHKFGSAVEQAYNRTSMLERRRPVMQDWADFLSGDAATGEVLPIKRGKRR